MTTTTIAAGTDDRRSILALIGRYLTDLARVFRAARETERLMQLSDDQLARRGLRRDEIVSRTFAAYLEA